MGVVYLICVGIASYVNGVQEPSSTLAAVAGVAGLVGTVLHIMQSIKLAKSFGKGKLWGALLFFFPYIFTLILGFGKAEYIGNTTVAQEAQPEEAPQEEIPQITE